MDDYRSIRLELYRGADVFLVCFDIGRPATLQSVIDKVNGEYSPGFWTSHDASCGFYPLAASDLSSYCIKPVGFIK